MKWLDNKYTLWYNKLIEIAKTKKRDGYLEKHHVIPKCFGGSNTKDNLVLLTAREHFLAHHLLTKMTEGLDKRKMTWALHRMAFSKVEQRKLKWHEIEIARKLHAQTQSDRVVTEETRQKMSQNNVGFSGRRHSEESKRKTSQKLKGRPATHNMNGANNPFFGRKHTAETRAKISKNHRTKKAKLIEVVDI